MEVAHEPAGYFIASAKELGNLNCNLTAVLRRIEERIAKPDEMMSKHEARISMFECKKSELAEAARVRNGLGDLLTRWVVYVIVWLLAALLGEL